MHAPEHERSVRCAPRRLAALLYASRAVDPVTLDVTIDRPREEVFAYLADIANHPEFIDHFLKDWRLLREDSDGRGAGARYRQDARFDRFGYYDLNLAEVEPPYRIVGVGRGGKYNRIKTFHAVDARADDRRRHAAGVRVRDRAAAPDRPPHRGAQRAPRLVPAQRAARRCGACAASSRRTATAARARPSAV